MPERDAFEEWWESVGGFTVDRLPEKHLALDAFEAGARSRDAEVEELRSLLRRVDSDAGLES